MHLCVFQRGWETVCADEMFLGNKQTGARAGFPLGWLLELFRCVIQFDRDRRRRSGFWTRRLLSFESIAELDNAPPNADGGNQKEHRRHDDRYKIVICLNPVGDFCHGYFLTTNGHE